MIDRRGVPIIRKDPSPVFKRTRGTLSGSSASSVGSTLASKYSSPFVGWLILFLKDLFSLTNLTVGFPVRVLSNNLYLKVILSASKSRQV